MKFRNEQDKEQFLLEVGKKGDKESFIKRRTSLVKKVVNFRRSQRSKDAWKKHRFRYITGIRKFHRSVAGKKFHRQLSRFMLTRLTRNEMLAETRQGALVAISSIRTHLYLEKQYFMSVNEQAEFQEMYSYAIPVLLSAEKRLLNYEELDENEVEVLFRFINPREFLKESDEEVSDKQKRKLESQWDWNHPPASTFGLTEMMKNIFGKEGVSMK